MLTVFMFIGNMLHQGCPLLLLHLSVVSTGGSNLVTVVDKTFCPESDISTIPFLGIGLEFLWNTCIYKITKSIKRQIDKLWKLSRRYVIETYNTFSHMPEIKVVLIVVVLCSHEFLHHSVSVGHKGLDMEAGIFKSLQSPLQSLQFHVSGPSHLITL